jgi:hypothetical protein
MGPWARVDGDPRTPARDPVLAPQAGAAPDAGAGFEMLRVGDPALSIEQTTTGRAFFRMYYTGQGADPHSAIGAAASYDGGCGMVSAEHGCFSRVGQAVYSERTAAVRAGAFEPLDDRSALLWVATASGGQRVITAAIAPVTAQLAAPTTQ